jgi:hypothetical protein
MPTILFALTLILLPDLSFARSARPDAPIRRHRRR